MVASWGGRPGIFCVLTAVLNTGKGIRVTSKLLSLGKAFLYSDIKTKLVGDNVKGQSWNEMSGLWPRSLHYNAGDDGYSLLISFWLEFITIYGMQRYWSKILKDASPASRQALAA